MIAMGLLALAGVRPGGAQAAAENLIQNPGFESNQDWWGFDTSFGAATGNIAFDDPMAIQDGDTGTYYFDDFSLTATAAPVGLRNPGPAGGTSMRSAAPLPAVDAAGRSVRTERSRGPAVRRYFRESGTR
jgi:hypothetical protein